MVSISLKWSPKYFTYFNAVFQPEYFLVNFEDYFKNGLFVFKSTFLAANTQSNEVFTISGFLFKVILPSFIMFTSM